MTEYATPPIHPALQGFIHQYFAAQLKKGEVKAQQLVESYLLHHAHHLNKPFSVKDMSPVADYIERQNGVVTIQQLEDKFHISRRWLEKQFAAQIGMSPKDFVRITRFNALLAHLMTISARFQDVPCVCWCEMIDKFGYYDQSHLIHDFHDFTGQSPTQFFKDAFKE